MAHIACHLANQIPGIALYNELIILFILVGKKYFSRYLVTKNSLVVGQL